MADEDIPLADLEEEESEDGDGEVAFYEDPIGSVDFDGASKAVEEVPGQAAGEPRQAAEAQESGGAAPGPTAACSQCGLHGHTSAICPLGAPENIDLGEIEESDSDNELSKNHPMLDRYAAAHIGALVPKTRRGTNASGGGRYFGNEKEKSVCWACGAKDHESQSCPGRGCHLCFQLGHEGRDCAQKHQKCSHCHLRGHVAIACPTLSLQQVTQYDAVRCMRCGGRGHLNCGPLPSVLAASSELRASFIRPGAPCPWPAWTDEDTEPKATGLSTKAVSPAVPLFAPSVAWRPVPLSASHPPPRLPVHIGGAMFAGRGPY